MPKSDVVLVSGQRNLNDYPMVRAFLELVDPIVIIEGGAAGADTIAHLYARRIGMPQYILDWRATYTHLPAEVGNMRMCVYTEDWDTYGKGAGHKRNAAMIRLAELYRKSGYSVVCLAFWDERRFGASRGTKNCWDQVTKLDTFPRYQLPADCLELMPATRAAKFFEYLDQGWDRTIPAPPKSHPEFRALHFAAA